MGDVELWRCERVKLMNVFAVSHHAFTMRYMEVTSYFVHFHNATHTTTFVTINGGKVTGAIAQTLCGVAQNVNNTPLS
jgi:hypothetical protein